MATASSGLVSDSDGAAMADGGWWSGTYRPHHVDVGHSSAHAQELAARPWPVLSSELRSACAVNDAEALARLIHESEHDQPRWARRMLADDVAFARRRLHRLVDAGEEGSRLLDGYVLVVVTAPEGGQPRRGVAENFNGGGSTASSPARPELALHRVTAEHGPGPRASVAESLDVMKRLERFRDRHARDVPAHVLDELSQALAGLHKGLLALRGGDRGSDARRSEMEAHLNGEDAASEQAPSRASGVEPAPAALFRRTDASLLLQAQEPMPVWQPRTGPPELEDVHARQGGRRALEPSRDGSGAASAARSAHDEVVWQWTTAMHHALGTDRAAVDTAAETLRPVNDPPPGERPAVRVRVDQELFGDPPSPPQQVVGSNSSTRAIGTDPMSRRASAAASAAGQLPPRPPQTAPVGREPPSNSGRGASWSGLELAEDDERCRMEAEEKQLRVELLSAHLTQRGKYVGHAVLGHRQPMRPPHDASVAVPATGASDVDASSAPLQHPSWPRGLQRAAFNATDALMALVDVSEASARQIVTPFGIAEDFAAFVNRRVLAAVAAHAEFLTIEAREAEARRGIVTDAASGHRRHRELFAALGRVHRARRDFFDAFHRDEALQRAAIIDVEAGRAYEIEAEARLVHAAASREAARRLDNAQLREAVDFHERTMRRKLQEVYTAELARARVRGWEACVARWQYGSPPRNHPVGGSTPSPSPSSNERVHGAAAAVSSSGALVESPPRTTRTPEHLPADQNRLPRHVSPAATRQSDLTALEALLLDSC
jgi:hypothetical protein